jgi:protein-tyrosine-phosphatase
MWTTGLRFLIMVGGLPFATPYSISNHGHSPDQNLVFSLKEYQRQSALETSTSLDGSRLHFQILFVDDDNAQGRIAEGLLAKIAEDNDAMGVLFPASATISASRRAPKDATAPPSVLHICHDLGLCPSRSGTVGTEFATSYLDEYDLIVCMSEEIRGRIFRSLEGTENQDHYRPRCRLLSEFLSTEFVSNRLLTSVTTTTAPAPNDQRSRLDTLQMDQWKMLDAKYQEKVYPYLNDVVGRSSALFAECDLIHDWPVTQAGLIWACAGIAKFCLTTLEVQMQDSLDSLLQRLIHKPQHLQQSWSVIDMQLRRCNASVTGYFSPEQRHSRFVFHLKGLRQRWELDQPEGNKDSKY